MGDDKKIEGISAADSEKFADEYDKQADKAGSVFSGRDGGGSAADVGASAKIEPAKTDGFDISDEAKGKD